MKLCIYAENYQRGGIDTFLTSLLNAWPVENDEITIFLNSENPFVFELTKRVNRPIRIITYENRMTRQTNQLVNLFSVPRSRFIRLVMNQSLECINIILFPMLVLSTYYKLKRVSIEALLVVNGGYPGGINCRAASVAGRLLLGKNGVVFSFHNYAVKSKLSRRILEAPIDFLVSRSAKTFISVSKSCLNSLNSRFFLRSCRGRKVVFNGIKDPGIPKIKGESSNKQDNQIYCVVIGTFEPRKGHDFLLDAFKYVLNSKPNVILYILGTGSVQDKERIVNRISSLGIGDNVILPGYVEEINELIRSSSAVLVPSQSYESFGITIIEAMAMGVPVVATDVGGIPEVLGSNIGGIICPRNDIKAFGLAIIKFLENREFADKVGGEGRLRFEQKFTSHEMALHYRDALKMDLN
jgi:glycosyltransferase involved in cell wall biosynthesis